jgi:hypothetical protein
MDTFEIKLLNFVFCFHRLSWREEFGIKYPPNEDRRRVQLAYGLTEVSGLKVASPEEALKVFKAIPMSVIHRVYILYMDALQTPRMFNTVGLYQAPEPNRLVRKFEEQEEQRERIMDRVEQELETKFGRKELDEQREIELQMLKKSKGRGLTKASPDVPAPKPKMNND